jgi:hypothetical protein
VLIDAKHKSAGNSNTWLILHQKYPFILRRLFVQDSTHIRMVSALPFLTAMTATRGPPHRGD